MMAARFEEDLQCPSCLEIFKDPVFLPCSHSICRTCVEKWWEDKDSRPCPVCRTECRSMELPSNLTLRNMCEKVSTKSDDMCKAFSQISTKSKDLCRSHKEKLKLFCLDHQELVCLVCRDSEIHANHKFRPIDEVAKGNKKKLQKVLQDVKKRLKDYNEVMDKCNKFSEYIKVQREKVESKIKKDFEELRHFLQVEEEARLSAVREEERNKTQILKEGMKALNMHMVALSNMIRTAEEQLMSDDLSLMKNFQTLMTRMQKPSDKPKQITSEFLLDEAKHVRNLKFTVWERMKEIVSYSPVILNPHAAGVRLSLSEDLTSVSAADEEQHRPQIAEVCGKNVVFGSALTSQVNSWDVEVGDSTEWSVGVMWQQSFSIDVFWIVCHDDEYRIFSEQSKRWDPPVKLKRIRFHVDTNTGSLSVTESLTNTFLHQENLSNWTQSSDMEILPLFFTEDKNPLKILPVPHRVTIQNQ